MVFFRISYLVRSRLQNKSTPLRTNKYSFLLFEKFQMFFWFSLAAALIDFNYEAFSREKFMRYIAVVFVSEAIVINKEGLRLFWNAPLQVSEDIRLIFIPLRNSNQKAFAKFKCYQ